MDTSLLLFITVTFVLAGFVKGVIGLGLPTIAVGVLGVVMAPAQAAALLAIPNLATNGWQIATGPDSAARCAGSGRCSPRSASAPGPAPALLQQEKDGPATLWLGARAGALCGRWAEGRQAARATSWEGWLSPVIGFATGIVTAATGVFVLPGRALSAGARASTRTSWCRRSASPSSSRRWRLSFGLIGAGALNLTVARALAAGADPGAGRHGRGPVHPQPHLGRHLPALLLRRGCWRWAATCVGEASPDSYSTSICDLSARNRA